VRTTKRSTRYAAIAIGLAFAAASCGGSDGGTKTSSGGTNAPASTPTETAGDTTPATTAPSETTAVAAAAGGTITYAAEQEYTSYNNGAADQGLVANTLVLNMVQPGPYISNPDLTLTVWQDMMDSVEVTSKDPQVVVYKVKPTAVWSDGNAIDCDDFYMAWLTGNGAAGNAKNPDGTDALDADGNPVPVFNTASTTGYEDISKVECSDDDHTITTTYSKQFVDYQGLFGALLPAHVVEAKSGVADITKATDAADLQKLGDVWNKGFIGFDPTMALSGSWYSIDTFTPGETLILKRNEKFYGKPGIADEIVVRQVPDATQQPAALENGDVQVISPQPNADLLAQLKAVSGVKTEVDQGVTFEHYDFNQANEFLKDLKVRQAFAKCIDRQEIVDTLVATLNPDATVLNNRIYIPSSPDYKDNSGDYAKRDVAGAKALLTAAGFTFNASGIAEKGGKTLTLRLGRRDPNPRRQSTNELVIKQCKEAGFDLTDDPAENFNSERLPASDYDIALFAWQATASISSNTSIYVPGGGQNWNNYTNPDIQAKFDAANIEFDVAKRADMMNAIDVQLWADMATLPLFQFQDLVAYSDTVSGVVYNGPLGVTWNANEWALTA
jgi:peptide/nickel transport system substrate-binding protein